MKIGIDALFLTPESHRGIDRVARGLVRGLGALEEGHAMLAYAAREGSGLGGLLPEKRLFFRADNRPARVLAQTAFLGRAAQKHGMDVLLCPANLCPLLSPLPRVLLIHDLAPLRFPGDFSAVERRLWRMLMPLSARAAERIVTVSEFSASEVSGLLRVPREKIRVVNPGVDEFFRGGKGEALRPERPEILCVSKGAGYKNLDGLLKACGLLAERGRDFSLAVAGLDQEAGERLRALGRGIGSRLDIAGPLSDPELAARYRRAALVVNPSRYEGFGLPLLEAMAAGAPVAASRACAEAAGDAGLLFSPDSPAEMAGAMEKLLDDPGLARELREKGRLRARAFTWERSAREILAVLREAAGD